MMQCSTISDRTWQPSFKAPDRVKRLTSLGLRHVVNRPQPVSPFHNNNTAVFVPSRLRILGGHLMQDGLSTPQDDAKNAVGGHHPP